MNDFYEKQQEANDQANNKGKIVTANKPLAKPGIPDFVSTKPTYTSKVSKKQALSLFHYYFAAGMSQENYGLGEGKWVVDHKIPLSIAKDEQEVYRLNHFTNLQPMWWRENMEKGSKV